MVHKSKYKYQPIKIVEIIVNITVKLFDDYDIVLEICSASRSL